jgi:glucose uptake protein GlcU
MFLAHSGGNLTPAVGYVLGAIALIFVLIGTRMGARYERQGDEEKARRYRHGSRVMIGFAVLFLARAIARF